MQLHKLINKTNENGPGLGGRRPAAVCDCKIALCSCLNGMQFGDGKGSRKILSATSISIEFWTEVLKPI